MSFDFKRLTLSTGRVLYLLDGHERTLDSIAIAEWCDEHAGSERWAQVYFGETGKFDIVNEQVVGGRKPNLDWMHPLLGHNRASLAVTYAFMDMSVAAEFRLKWDQ